MADVMRQHLAGEISLEDAVKGPERAITQSLGREHGFEPLRIEGTLPPALRGTLYRNGPGTVGLFGRHYTHVFEGDGAVSAVRFDGEGVQGAIRLVRSEGLVEEFQQKKMLYSFSVPWPMRFWRSMVQKKSKNTANTSVMCWQGRLFALMEAALPTELSPETLETLGERDFDGVIQHSFSAHPHTVPGRKAIYNFGMNYGKDSSIELFAFPFQGTPRHLGSVPLAFPVMLHDFIATEKHLVFFVAPARVKVLRALLSVGPFEKMFTWDPAQGTEIIVVPIDDPAHPIRFHVDPFYQWHFANGFELEGGRLAIDLVRYTDFRSFTGINEDNYLGKKKTIEDWGQLGRIIVEPAQKKLHWEPFWDQICEFPRIHPDYEGKDYRYVWLESAPGGGVHDQIIKLDVETKQQEVFYLDEGEVASEPIFVPREDAKSEDDGYVLSLIYHRASHTSYVAVFDGLDLLSGPLCKAWFDHHIPGTFHGNWMPAVSS